MLLLRERCVAETLANSRVKAAVGQLVRGRISLETVQIVCLLDMPKHHEHQHQHVLCVTLKYGDKMQAT